MEGLIQQIKLKQIKTDMGNADHVFCCADYWIFLYLRRLF